MADVLEELYHHMCSGELILLDMAEPDSSGRRTKDYDELSRVKQLFKLNN